MRRGRSGDGDRLGRVFLTSSDIGAAGAADRVEVGRRIVGKKLGADLKVNRLGVQGPHGLWYNRAVWANR